MSVFIKLGIYWLMNDILCLNFVYGLNYIYVVLIGLFLKLF